MKLLIVSDIHANWPALRAVLESETDLDDILCLGDLVHYGPHPAECVAWARQMLPAGWVIQGDHDWAAGGGGNPHCWSSDDAPLAQATREFTSEMLAQEFKNFLAGITIRSEFELDGARCAACHASPTYPIFGQLCAESPAGVWESELTFAGWPDFLFLGHTHLPMKKRFGNTLVVNPGSVGRPKHGNPQAAYAVWEDGEVTLRSVLYDVDETIRAYQGLGVDEPTLRVLYAGLLLGEEVPLDVVQAFVEL
jgi:predicted phosphodiesterase